jgi:Zn-finger nucleic acid-binding protein
MWFAESVVNQGLPLGLLSKLEEILLEKDGPRVVHENISRELRCLIEDHGQFKWKYGYMGVAGIEIPRYFCKRCRWVWFDGGVLNPWLKKRQIEIEYLNKSHGGFWGLFPWTADLRDTYYRIFEPIKRRGEKEEEPALVKQTPGLISEERSGIAGIIISAACALIILGTYSFYRNNAPLIRPDNIFIPFSILTAFSIIAFFALTLRKFKPSTKHGRSAHKSLSFLSIFTFIIVPGGLIFSDSIFLLAIFVLTRFYGYVVSVVWSLIILALLSFAWRKNDNRIFMYLSFVLSTLISCFYIMLHFL